MNIEKSKENIKPLRGGRDLGRLIPALEAQNDEAAEATLKQQRSEFERKINAYTGPDPLSNWFEYIYWLEQAYPKKGHEGSIDDILRKCLMLFEHSQQYSQDSRLIKLWLKYIDTQTNPIEIFLLLNKRGVGTMIADFYIGWAYYHIVNNDMLRAKSIYDMGLKARAEPLQHLQNVYDNFVSLMEQRESVGEETHSQKTVEMLALHRQALTSLRHYKKKNTTFVPSQRTGDNLKNLYPGILPADSDNQKHRSNARHFVYEDGNEQNILDGAVPSSSQVTILKDPKETENAIEPGPWTKAKGLTPMIQITTTQTPFEIHTDPAPEIGFSECKEDFSDWKIPIFLPELDTKSKPMYIKKEVYCDGKENSFEEINAAKYYLKRKISQSQNIQVYQDQQYEDQSYEKPHIENHNNAVYDNNAYAQYGNHIESNQQRVQNQASHVSANQTQCDSTQQVASSALRYPISDQSGSQVASNNLNQYSAPHYISQNQHNTSNAQHSQIEYTSNNASVPTGSFGHMSPNSSRSALTHSISGQHMMPTHSTTAQVMTSPHFPSDHHMVQAEPSVQHMTPNQVQMPHMTQPQSSVQYVAQGQHFSASEQYANQQFVQNSPVQFVGNQYTRSTGQQMANQPITPTRQYPSQDQQLTPTNSSAHVITPTRNNSYAIQNQMTPINIYQSYNSRSNQYTTATEQHLTPTNRFTNSPHQLQTTPSGLANQFSNQNENAYQANQYNHHEYNNRQQQYTNHDHMSYIRQSYNGHNVQNNENIIYTQYNNNENMYTQQQQQYNNHLMNDHMSYIRQQPESFGLQMSQPAQPSNGHHWTNHQYSEPQNNQQTYQQPTTPVKCFDETASTQFFNQNIFRAQTSTPVYNRQMQTSHHPVNQQQQINDNNLPSVQKVHHQSNIHVKRNDFQTPTLNNQIQHFNNSLIKESKQELSHSTSNKSQMIGSFAMQTNHNYVETSHIQVSDSDDSPSLAHRIQQNASNFRKKSPCNIRKSPSLSLIEENTENILSSVGSLATDSSKQSTIEPSDKHNIELLHTDGSKIFVKSKSENSVTPKIKEQAKTPRNKYNKEDEGKSPMFTSTKQIINSSFKGISNNKFSNIKLDETHRSFDDIKVLSNVIENPKSFTIARTSEEPDTSIMSSPEDSRADDNSLLSTPGRNESDYSILIRTPNQLNENSSYHSAQLSFTSAKAGPNISKTMRNNLHISSRHDEYNNKWSSADEECSADTFEIAENNIRENDKKYAAAIIEKHLAKEKIDPFNSELCEAFLNHMGFPERDDTRYVPVVNMTQPKVSNNYSVGRRIYSIEKELGKGAFGSIYKAVDQHTDNIVVLKYQKPARIWEYYICREIRNRINNHDILPGFMDVSLALVSRSSNILVSELSKYGSLLDCSNRVRNKTSKPLNEIIVMFFASQLLSLVHYLHKSEIIHGDIKPDNILLMTIPNQVSHLPCLQFIDFGCAIDMRLFPEGTVFKTIVTTDGFTCSEMRNNNPWTYQTDLYCLAGTVHVCLFGKYMKLKNERAECGKRAIDSTLPRYFQKNIWQCFFQVLLNIKDCSNQPDLLKLKALFDEYLSKHEKDFNENIRHLDNIMNNR